MAARPFVHEGVNLVVLLAQDLGVIGVGADPLEAEQQGMLQGEDVGVRRRVGFQAHRLGLLAAGPPGRRPARRWPGPAGKSPLPPLALTLAFEAFPQLHALLDEFDEPLGIEVDIGQGGKTALLVKTLTSGSLTPTWRPATATWANPCRL